MLSCHTETLHVDGMQIAVATGQQLHTCRRFSAAKGGNMTGAVDRRTWSRSIDIVLHLYGSFDSSRKHSSRRIMEKLLTKDLHSGEAWRYRASLTNLERRVSEL